MRPAHSVKREHVAETILGLTSWVRPAQSAEARATKPNGHKTTVSASWQLRKLKEETPPQAAAALTHCFVYERPSDDMKTNFLEDPQLQFSWNSWKIELIRRKHNNLLLSLSTAMHAVATVPGTEETTSRTATHTRFITRSSDHERHQYTMAHHSCPRSATSMLS